MLLGRSWALSLSVFLSAYLSFSLVFILVFVLVLVLILVFVLFFLVFLSELRFSIPCRLSERAKRASEGFTSMVRTFPYLCHIPLLLRRSSN